MPGPATRLAPFARSGQFRWGNYRGTWTPSERCGRQRRRARPPAGRANLRANLAGATHALGRDSRGTNWVSGLAASAIQSVAPECGLTQIEPWSEAIGCVTKKIEFCLQRWLSLQGRLGARRAPARRVTRRSCQAEALVINERAGARSQVPPPGEPTLSVYQDRRLRSMAMADFAAKAANRPRSTRLPPGRKCLCPGQLPGSPGSPVQGKSGGETTAEPGHRANGEDGRGAAPGRLPDERTDGPIWPACRRPWAEIQKERTG